jgi:hypothetical protein
MYAYHPITKEHIQTDVIADWMATTQVAPPNYDTSTHGCFWQNDAWVLVEGQQEMLVPEVVSKRQAELALLETLHPDQSIPWLDVIHAAIDSIQDATQKRIAQIEYNSSVWERGSAFLQDFWTQLGGTSQQLDQLFVLASTK